MSGHKKKWLDGSWSHLVCSVQLIFYPLVFTLEIRTFLHCKQSQGKRYNHSGLLTCVANRLVGGILKKRAAKEVSEDKEQEGQEIFSFLRLPWLAVKCRTQPSSSFPRAVSPVCLSPSFRLLRFYVAEKNNGSLEEIDALLGIAEIWYCPSSVLIYTSFC